MLDAHHDDGSRSRRRRRTALGVVGLATLLGAGSFLVGEKLNLHPDAVSGEAAAPASTPETGLGADPTPNKPPVTGTPSPKVALATPSKSPSPISLAQRLATARAANAKLGTEVRPALPLPLPPADVVAADEVSVVDIGNLKRDGATVRVISARQDLTGQRELTIAADRGQVVGSASCTDNFRFSGGAAAVRKPTMLLCWQTSAAKSVITLAVSASGRPSSATSVALIKRQWAKLG
jgi:hypothetical protein